MKYTLEKSFKMWSILINGFIVIVMEKRQVNKQEVVSLSLVN